MNNIIFLDIDGVLQPPSNQLRFKHDLKKLRTQLAERFQNDDYLAMDPYDLGAVYYDWDKSAIERLRRLCAEAPAEIVITSDWRRYSPHARLRAFFAIHDLERYVIGETPRLGPRCDEIHEYLQHNRNIDNFVIIDDGYVAEFEARYPQNFAYCRYVLDEACYDKSISILKYDHSNQGDRTRNEYKY